MIIIWPYDRRTIRIHTKRSGVFGCASYMGMRRGAPLKAADGVLGRSVLCGMQCHAGAMQVNIGWRVVVMHQCICFYLHQLALCPSSFDAASPVEALAAWQMMQR